jgi:hypothetical protein
MRRLREARFARLSSLDWACGAGLWYFAVAA